jgi:hypothetical protein
MSRSRKRGFSETNKLTRQPSVGRYTASPIDEEIEHERNVMPRTDDGLDMPIIVQLPGITNTNDIQQILNQFGTELALVADSPAQASERFTLIQNELNAALVLAFDTAKNEAQQRQIVLQEQQSQETTTMTINDEETRRERQKQQFFDSLNPLVNRISSELTLGEQARVLGMSLQILNNCLHDYDLSIRTANQLEPNYYALLSEIRSIVYTWASTQLAVTITNVYSAAPQLTKKLMAIITSVGIIYNYLPGALRNVLVGVPFLGNLFSLMNHFNRDDVMLVQTSAATVTSIYYLLRNSGMDPTDSIGALTTMAAATSQYCAKTTGEFVCRNVTGAIERIRESTGNVVNAISNRLGDIMTEDYADFSFGDSSYESQQSNILSQNSLSSQSSSSSQSSISSRRSVNSNKSQNSAVSEQSMEIVESLLNTPVSEGGINISGNMSYDIIEERFTPILQGIVTAPILANPIQMVEASEAIPVAETLSSNDSVDSSEEGGWAIWLYGRSHSGGRRFRKSRRQRKMMKTRKGRGRGKGKRRSTKISKKRIHRRRRSRKMYSR